MGFVFYLLGCYLLNDLFLIIPIYSTFYFEHIIALNHAFLWGSILLSFYGIQKANQINVQIYHLNTAKKGINTTLLFISDMHIDSSGMTYERAQEIIKKINTYKPDFVIFGGDTIESHPDYFLNKHFDHLLSTIKSAYPPIVILGNHEYYGTAVSKNITAFQKAGCLVLRDGVFNIPKKKITFIGRDDRINKKRTPLSNLIQNSPSGLYQIVIEHDPKYIEESIKGKVDLYVAGHTHNGQIFPFNLLVKFVFKNAYGYQRFDQTDTIVSSGIGTWGPTLRIGTQAEIVVIYLSSIKDTQDT